MASEKNGDGNYLPGLEAFHVVGNPFACRDVEDLERHNKNT